MREHLNFVALRKILKKLHLILGLTSGIVIFIICITGCIYTFKTEIINTNHYTKVEEYRGIDKLNLSEIINKYEYNSNNRIVKLYDYKNPKKALIIKAKQNNINITSYINPYTGEIIKNVNNKFFTTILHIHRNLLLGEIGGKIVAWAVLIFMLCLLSGTFLWLPSNIKKLATKKTLKAKLSIKTKANWARKIYDLHSVLGIYALILLLIISLSGLVWSFNTVEDTIYNYVCSEKKHNYKRIKIKACKLNNKSFDIIKSQLKLKKDNSYTITKYSFPRNKRSPIRVLSIKEEGRYSNANTYYAHPFTGIILQERLYKNKNRGEKLRSSNYDIHTGSILGIIGKILAFFASLIGASLPITGILFFLKRKKKGKHIKKR